MHYSLQFLQSVILMCQMQAAPVPAPPPLAAQGCWNTMIDCTDRQRATAGYSEANALAVCMKTLGAPKQ